MKGVTGWRGSDPANMLILPTESVIKVAATLETTVFVTDCGKLYVGFYNGNEKGSLKQIDVGSKIIQDAAIYRNQVVLVTDKGAVFSYNIQDEILNPIHIHEPKKTCSHGKEENGKRVYIQKVSAGVDHILYLSTKREIWVQGKGPALGLFTNKIENEITNPTRVDFFKGRKVLQAVAGHYFTIALVEALPPIQNCGTTSTGEPLTDLDSYVRICDLCRKETGDRVLFEDVDENDKCPLGLGVQKDGFCKGEFLSPTPSSSGFDGRLSRGSNLLEECESDYVLDVDFTSGETSCNGTTLNSPTESRYGLEMKAIPRLRKHSSVEGFEVIEGCVESTTEKSASSGALTITRDAAKQFFSRPLSWVTSGSLDSDTIGLDSERFSYKYPIDSATELIRENVASAASLVATSVRTVGDKVGQLSRHFSSTDCVESTGDRFSPDGESLNMDLFQSKPVYNLSKSESHEWNSLPRHSVNSYKKTHVRTASAGKNQSKIFKEGVFVIEKNLDQVEKSRKELIDSGKNILNSEVWGWGSSSKGQLGLGDQSHRTTPTNIISLNHAAVKKVVCGSHHTAALTIDGQVFTWGSKSCPKQAKSTSDLCSPLLLLLPNEELAKDVASGDDFLIIISLTGKIFYADILSREENGPSIREFTVFDSSTSFHSVMCQSQSIVCTTDALHPKIISYMKNEKSYLTRLKEATQHIVRPFLALSNNNYNNDNKTSQINGVNNNNNNSTVQVKIQQTRVALLQSFVQLTYAIVNNLQEVFDNHQYEITSVLPIIHRVQEMKSVYMDYVQAVCNAIAISGLNLETKEAESLVEKNKVHLEALIPSEDKKTNSEIFSYLLLLPLNRIDEYERFLLSIRADTESFYSPFSLDKIKVAHTHWKQLAVVAYNGKVEAEQTRTFWSSCSPKLFEALANPTRRLIRDSRKTPINLHNAGRFSSHSFILLSDLLIHNTYNSFVSYNLSSMWVEALPSVNNSQNALQITVPEETLTLVCPSALDKTQWLQGLQDNIKSSLQPGESMYMISRSPPLVRNATYTFTKHTQYKDATYSGQWFCGKMHGEGTLTWPDGKRYIGQFRHNEYQGLGRLDVPSGIGFNVYEGFWKKGKLEGRGVICYANKNIYVGFLHESQPHGHGELKKGKFSSEAPSVYTGEWHYGVKHGYGVLDEIAQGEKYHGMWQNNNRHGPGMVVTMNDVYYEGNFNQNKLTGFGLMILEDGTSFEGELGPGGTFNGKGTLRYPSSGDYMEGTFSGSWSDGIKVNGILHKGNGLTPTTEQPLPKSFGKFSVPAHQKWTSLFQHCEEQMGIVPGTPIQTPKVWSTLASFIEVEKQAILRSQRSLEPLDGLDKIPEVASELTLDNFKSIQEYLEKAFLSPLHPLGQLMHSLVDAFRATYGGVVAHPRLLQYAVKEIRSCSSRLYRIVRILFPALPSEGDHQILESENAPNEDVPVTAASVIHPWLLPHLYAPLSPLYVRHHQKQDQEYWQRLLKWNKQSDIALMTFLGVDLKFWLLKDENLVEKSQSLASEKDKHFTEAVEMLQLLSTSFTPKDKLLLIHRCGIMINKEVVTKLGRSFILSMDDLLPLFLYVVVRARIQHLGAEIGLIDDLIDPCSQNGELDHMFTTLKACYFHILHEKPTPGM